MATNSKLKTQKNRQQDPKFTYKKTEFNSKDSADYKKGYISGLSDKTSKPKNLGGEYVRGINDRYNDGYSEGKDVAIVKRGDKGLDAYEKARLSDFKIEQKNREDAKNAQLREKIAKEKKAFIRTVDATSNNRRKPAPSVKKKPTSKKVK